MDLIYFGREIAKSRQGSFSPNPAYLRELFSSHLNEYADPSLKLDVSFIRYENTSLFPQLFPFLHTAEQRHGTQSKQGLSTQKTASGVLGRSEGSERNPRIGPFGVTEIEFG